MSILLQFGIAFISLTYCFFNLLSSLLVIGGDMIYIQYQFIRQLKKDRHFRFDYVVLVYCFQSILSLDSNINNFKVAKCLKFKLLQFATLPSRSSIVMQPYQLAAAESGDS